MPEVEPFQKLPINVSPQNYQLFLQPDLNEYNFKGSVDIDLKINEPTSNILLNCLELVIKDVTIIAEGKTHKASTSTLNTSKETLDLTFDITLQPGDAVLKINFEGSLNLQLKGFYRSKYTVGAEERYAAVTQFEATDARRCFPCWDEPAIKATFDITLAVPSDKISLSNMNVVSQTPHPLDSSLHIVKFAKTPRMSTYLVAVVVGEYDYVENILPDGIVIRVYTPLGKKEQGLFALEVASKVLPYYREYFKMEYPLPKMDLITIANFNGAMENWGLVTYSESMLLVDPQNTSTANKQDIAIVVGHEIAHQWFGNLVTMEWWTHLWLNEGYATFGEFLCVSELFPEYDIWTQFVTTTYICALELDALRNSHPIESPVGHPSEVEEIFDTISYCKGASVIRMIHNYIGDEEFRKGMNAYLTQHRFGNATTKDLWDALREASGKPIDKVMSSWTEKAGFPMISVSSQQDGSNRILTLTQQRFMADGSSDPSQTKWIVPMSFLSSGSNKNSVKYCTLDSKSSQMVLEGVLPNNWVKLNVGSLGFYRTKYPSEMLNQLHPAISSKALPPLDRLNIIDDLFAMVKAGHSSTVDVLRFLRSYEDETDYTVWAAIHNILSQLNILLSHTSFQPLYFKFVCKLLAKVMAKVGWDAKPGEGHLDALLRSLTLHRLGTCGDESIVEEAKKRLAAHLSGTTLLPADLRGSVYQSVFRNDLESFFQQMVELYRATDLQEEQHRISTSLGSTTDPNLIQKVLQFAMSYDVTSRDAVFVVVSVTHSNAGRSAAWAFIKANLPKFIERYGMGNLLTRLVRFVTENFASEEMAIEIEEFFNKNDVPGTKRTIQQSCEEVRLRTAWLKRDAENIEKFLREET